MEIKMFGERLVSGVVLLILAIGIVFTGGNVLYVTVTAISLIGLMELYRALKFHKTPLAYAGYVGSLLVDSVILLGREDLLLHILIGLMMLFLVIYL